MNCRLRSAILGVLAIYASTSANEIEFIEDFALATDRQEVLQQLIPGTEEYYFYHCLHYQNTQRYDEVERLLKSWIKQHGETQGVQEIQHRQALLTYSQHPQKSLEYLRRQLDLQFNHQREQLDRKPQLPTRLDEQLIHRQQLTSQALRRYKNLQGITDQGLEHLATAHLNPIQRRHLLERLPSPDVAGLAELIVKDLKHEGSRGFGSQKIHGMLLLSQLEQCLQLQSDLLNESNFVNTYVRKLRPSDDVPWRYDHAEFSSYLDRLWQFVQRLAPSHNSLKAHVLYQRLVLDRSRGHYDRQRFMEYLKLPRRLSYVEPRMLREPLAQRYPADVNFDCRKFTQLPPIGNDEPLVRSYLEHFFLKDTGIQAYQPYVDDTYLKHLFAETKIVNGLGDAKKWYGMLPPAELQALRDRVDLDFAQTSQMVYEAEDPVSLDVLVKNASTLIVKVFEINTRNFYRQNLREVNTDIRLDGLVANWEKTFTYEEPPLGRVERHFEFPDLRRPGVYVVNMIGNGKSSRAVIRKGQHRFLVRTGSLGHVFTILDQRNQQVKNAAIWLGGHEYASDRQGEIVVPFSTSPGQQSFVITQGGYSTLHHFDHQAEDYELTAGIYVDREALLQHQQATVLVRPGLKLNGTPVTLSVLEDVRLVITATDHEGVQTTKEISDFQLHEDRESTCDIQIPPRLAALDFQLRARVENLSQAKHIDLQSTARVDVNGLDITDKIEDLHLAQLNEIFVLELRGRSGEVRPDRAVQLRLQHREFVDPVQVLLQTDDNGRIQLGQLSDIESLTATGPAGIPRTWRPASAEFSYYRSVSAVAGDSVFIPYTGDRQPLDRQHVSLLELRNGTPVADHFSKISLASRSLQIDDLRPGNYQLRLKREDQQILIRVTAGREEYGFALGASRLLELRGSEPLQIEAIDVGEKQVRVQLARATQFARVHVFATRYLPAFSSFQALARVRDAEPLQARWPDVPSLYVTGRDIGDEYRYIIDRKYAEKFPGNMLGRPSLLLNPWAVRTTETEQQLAEAGSDFEPSEDSAEPDQQRAAGLGGRGQAEKPQGANLDFLANASAVLANLRPDKDGVVVLDRNALGDHPQLHIVAVDPVTTTYRCVSLPESPFALKDLRLVDGLDPAKHYTRQKQITVVPAGGKFTVADITSADFDYYDSLQRVYKLFTSLNPNPHLNQFGFIRNWPDLSSDDKREKYSEYACHELHLFLYYKDREFFQDVIRPYLAHKKHKTFLDRWLLEEDLQEYRQLWNYQQLNIFERILLGRRLAEEAPHTVRHVNGLFQVLPPDANAWNRWFGTAVLGTALDTEDRLGVRSRLKKTLAKTAKSSRLLEKMQLGESISGRLDTAQGLALEAESEDMTLDAPAAAVPARGTVASGGDHYFFEDRGRGERHQRLYRRLDATQEWAENNFYKLPIEQQNAQLVTISTFWNDLANHPGNEPFMSEHFPQASRNFTEMMLALAILDLPFTAQAHQSEYEDARLTLTAGSPLVVFHEQVREVPVSTDTSPVLISQNFFRHGDRYEQVDGMRRDKFIADEFLVHTVYGCQIVITNPSSSTQKVSLLLQIPVGAIPVLGGKYTKAVELQLEPYHTETQEYFFYFPAAGDYPHFPVQVGQHDEVIAHANSFPFHVVQRPTKLDRESWPYVSQYGTDEDVLAFLRKHNLLEIDLDRIAFRMQDKSFFVAAIELLGKAHAYDDTLWSYGIKHNVPDVAAEYLQHADAFVGQCGACLDSRLLRIDPVIRKEYQHLDYRPLVNARAHRLGQQRQILNQRFYEQYHRLMRVLAYRTKLGNEELLTVTYYMLLQDRVGEALRFFSQVQRADLETQLQYDYFVAYLDLFQPAPDIAREIATQYANHPVNRWRDAFRNLQATLDEIDGQAPGWIDEQDRTQSQTEQARKQPAFDYEVVAGQVQMEYQNLGSIEVNYYLMDLELLFSRNPFVQQFSGQFSHIRPNHSQRIELSEPSGRFQFALPDNLAHHNVLVEITGGGKTKTQAFYSNSLSVQTVENYGHARVTHSQTKQPLPAVYFKVYAELRQGVVQFYKDGYTDLRGRLDYTSLSTDELDSVKRFSILILSEEHGAVVREAKPPQR